MKRASNSSQRYSRSRHLNPSHREYTRVMKHLTDKPTSLMKIRPSRRRLIPNCYCKCRENPVTVPLFTISLHSWSLTLCTSVQTLSGKGIPLELTWCHAPLKWRSSVPKSRKNFHIYAVPSSIMRFSQLLTLLSTVSNERPCNLLLLRSFFFSLSQTHRCYSEQATPLFITQPSYRMPVEWNRRPLMLVLSDFSSVFFFCSHPHGLLLVC